MKISGLVIAMTTKPTNNFNFLKGYWTYLTVLVSIVGATYAWFMGWIDNEKFLMILGSSSAVFGLRRAIRGVVEE